MSNDSGPKYFSLNVCGPKFPLDPTTKKNHLNKSKNDKFNNFT